MLQRTQIGPQLTTEDLDAIDDLLAEFDRGIEWTTGFLCAVVSGPDLIPPSGWLPSVMGEGAFDDLAQAQAGLELWSKRRPAQPQTSRLGAVKVGRNDPCPCGSGKKYKKCCLQ
jgi:uncharacterized protein YecA (UPF0149 family)